MADQYIFTMLGLNKYYGQKQVLKEINLCFFPGAKIGIVGENGAGKSTVLRIMAGLDDDFQGRAEITPGYSVGIVEQEPALDPDQTVREALESAFADTVAMLEEFDAVSLRMGESLSDDEMQEALDRMAELQDRLDAADAWNLDQRLRQAAEAMVLPDDDRTIGTLSGGEKRRVALCKALLEKPDLLLLDEPTNHLDAETIDWLEARLREYEGTVIIVTHDRYFLDNVTKWILELEGGRGIPWEGNYSSWLEQKLQRLAAENKKDGFRHKALSRELDWIRMSNQDRHELSRERLRSYEQLVARESAAAREDHSTIQIAPGPELGEQVIEARQLAKGFNGGPLFENLDFILPKGAIVGLVGPNGTGKTTLFRLITGAEKPDAGEIAIGKTVQLAHATQERDLLEGGRSLIDEVGEGATEVTIGKRTVPIRQYLSWFGFSGSSQQKTVDEFSGGERNRCLLAKVLKQGGNVLLLDEPTNDLDVNTLRMLEEAVLDFSGCIMVISHDRFFLNRICTHLLVFEGERQVRWFQGTYEDYERWRVKEFGTKLFENRRARYRKLAG